MLLSEIPNSIKLALSCLTKRCLKCYLGREQSFDKGFRAQFSIFSEIGFENWQISLLIKVLLIKKSVYSSRLTKNRRIQSLTGVPITFTSRR